MKVAGSSDTVHYIKMDAIEKTGVAHAGYTLKEKWTYRFIARELGIPPEMTVHPKEIHGCKVEMVSSSVNGGEGTIRSSSLTDVDSVITDEPGFALCLIVSDCAAVYMVDPVKRCIGLAHSGREGTKMNIVAATVDKMSACYGTDPEDVVAAISPCICRSCYEVDPVTAQEFVSCFRKGWRETVFEERNGRYFLDIAAAISLQLREAGIHQIQMPEYCTCHNEAFFSYRREGNDDSNAAWLMITKK